MRELADRADISVATLYRFFSSKEAVVRALVAEGLDRLTTAVGDVTEDDPVLRILAIVETSMSIATTEPERFRPIMIVATHPDWRITAIRSARLRIDMIRQGIIEAQKNGQLRDELDAELYAILIFRNYQLAMEDWAHQRSGGSQAASTAIYNTAVSLLAQANDGSRAMLVGLIRQHEEKALRLQPGPGVD